MGFFYIIFGHSYILIYRPDYDALLNSFSKMLSD